MQQGLYLKNVDHSKSQIIEESIFCFYCRRSFEFSHIKDDILQICSYCLNILKKNDSHNNTLNKFNLRDKDWETLRLLEIILEDTLPIIPYSKLHDFSSSKYGVVIKDQCIIGLCLDNIPLTQFPEEVYYLEKLEYLSLMNCNLHDLPESINELKSLRSLNLKHNTLEFLPHRFIQIHSLEKLSLTSNELRLLPDAIGILNSLKWLDIGENLLYALPKSFGQLINLEFCNLFYNQIKYLPKTLKNLKNLRDIGLGGNVFSKQSLKIIEKIGRKNSCNLWYERPTWNHLMSIYAQYIP